LSSSCCSFAGHLMLNAARVHVVCLAAKEAKLKQDADAAMDDGSDSDTAADLGYIDPRVRMPACTPCSRIAKYVATHGVLSHICPFRRCLPRRQRSSTPRRKAPSKTRQMRPRYVCESGVRWAGSVTCTTCSLADGDEGFIELMSCNGLCFI